MKAFLFFISVIILLIINNILYNKIDNEDFHLLQLFIAVVGMITFIFSWFNLEKNVYTKNYKIPLYFGIYIASRSVENVFSNYLKDNFPVFYAENKYVIFLGSVVILFGLVWRISLLYSKKQASSIAA